MGWMMGRARGAIKARLRACVGLVALASPAVAESVAVPRLLAGVPEADGGRTAGLEVALAPGWKTYWRAPGDAGVPPLFDWAGSDNLAAVAVEWPAPELFDTFGLTTLGYGGVVTLPLRLTPVDAGLPIRLRLGLDYGVCAEICIPERADLALDIAPGAEPEGAAAIASARALAPTPAAEGGVTAVDCGRRRAAGDGRGAPCRPRPVGGARRAAPDAVRRGPGRSGRP